MTTNLERAEAVGATFGVKLADTFYGSTDTTTILTTAQLDAYTAQASQPLPVALLERLSKTLTNLGYATPEGGMEHFGARIESQLYSLCEGVDSILTQATVEAKAVGAVPLVWESTTPAYIKFVTDARYKKFTHNIQKWYRPVCQKCTAHGANDFARDVEATHGIGAQEVVL